MKIESSNPQEILCLGNGSFVVSFRLFFWGGRVLKFGMVIMISV